MRISKRLRISLPWKDNGTKTISQKVFEQRPRQMEVRFEKLRLRDEIKEPLVVGFISFGLIHYMVLPLLVRLVYVLFGINVIMDAIAPTFAAIPYCYLLVHFALLMPVQNDKV